MAEQGQGQDRTALAGQGTVVMAIGTDADDRAVRAASELARTEGRPLYDDMRGDDDHKPREGQPFGATIARREGRATLAGYLDHAEAAGVEAGSWFPTEAGLGWSADRHRAVRWRHAGRVAVSAPPEHRRRPVPRRHSRGS